MVYVYQYSGSEDFVAALHRLDLKHLSLIVAALTASVFIAALRLRLLAHNLGHTLPTWPCVRVVALSQAAASVFFHIVGQLGSRGILLEREGVPVSTTILITLLERIIGLAILLALSVGGALFLYGGLSIDMQRGGADLAMIATGLVVAFCMVGLFWWQLLSRDQGRGSVVLNFINRSVLPTFWLTAAIQLATLVAFTNSAAAFAPHVDLVKLLAASTIVMLASALPISLGGWGVRELSAVVALGAIGVPPEAAFLSAVTVGILSLVVVISLGSIPLVSKARKPVEPGIAETGFNSFTVLGWLLPLAVAVLILFQVHVPVGQSKINVNFADPFVLVGGILLLSQCLRGGGCSGEYRG